MSRRSGTSTSTEESANCSSRKCVPSRNQNTRSCPRKLSTPELMTVGSDKCRRDKFAISRSRSSECSYASTGTGSGSTGTGTESAGLGTDSEPPQHEESIVLTEEQKAELKQAFSMFEKAGKGRIQARDLGELLRCLGWNPSEQDLEEARHELEVTARGTISFADVEAYVARRGGIYYGNNAEEDILVAFQVLDKGGNGKIEVEEFRHFMTTMGERMSEEEVEELLKSANRVGHEFIEYKDLMRAMQQHPT